MCGQLLKLFFFQGLRVNAKAVHMLLGCIVKVVDNKNKNFLVDIYGFFPQDEYSIKYKNYTGKIYMHNQVAKIGFLVGMCFFFFVKAGAQQVYQGKEDKIIPRSILFGDPKYVQPKISFDGKHLAYLSPCHGVLNVWVGKLGQHKSMHPVSNAKKRGVSYFFWSHDNEHVLYVDDYKGNENWRLYSVNIKTGRTKTLCSYKNTQVNVLATSERRPTEVLVGINKRRADFQDLYILNIKTGGLSLIYENNTFSWFVCDDALRVVVAGQNTPSGGVEVYKIGKNFSKVELLNIQPEDALTFNPLGVDKEKKWLFMLDSSNRDNAALVGVSLTTKERQILAALPKMDVDDVFFHPTDRVPLGYRGAYEKQQWFSLTPDFQEDINYLNNLAAGEFNIINSSLDGQKWIVEYTRDVGVPCYYFYDRWQKKAYFLFSKNPQLDPLPFTKMKTVIIPSRDRLPLVSYLSVPRWVQLKKYSATPCLPLILLVHGGPYARDYWGYNVLHQWLANRGYAVLSVNYRGSSGFGKNFANAGNGEWGGKMHDDLVDATAWAMDKGLTVKDKIAIMGGSYGGYAALVGLTKTPELFACAVDIVGPSNLKTLVSSVPEYWKPFFPIFKKMIGGDLDSTEGRLSLEKRSPLNYVDNIKRPLLIGHGAFDPRVKQAESDQMVHQMLAKGVPVTYVLYPDEGHGFRRPENRLSFFAVTEAFLNQHLKGRLEPLKEKDFKNSSIQIKAGKENITELKI